MLFYSYRQSGSLTNRHSGHQLPSCNASSLWGQCTEKDAPHHRGISPESASTWIKLVKLLQQEQRLILDEFSHVQRCFLLFRHRGLRASVLSAKGCSLFRFLFHSVAMLLPLAAASGRACVLKARKPSGRVGKRKAAKRPFFQRLRPLTSITKRRSNRVVAKPDRTIKISGVSPWYWNLNLRSLFPVTYGLQLSFTVMAAFISFRPTLSSGRQFAPSWTAWSRSIRPLRLTGNYHLESNPERHEKRHWQQLVTDFKELVLKLCAS